MIASLLLAAASTLVPVDTTWRTATYNLAPNNPPTFSMAVPKIPDHTTQAELCLSMQEHAWLHVVNGSTQPLWFQADQSLRNEVYADSAGAYRVFGHTAGTPVVVPFSNAIPPGGERLIEVQSASATLCDVIDPAIWPIWGKLYISFDYYYPAVFSLRGQAIDPQTPSIWESQGIQIHVAGWWHDGTGAPAPVGRLDGWVEFRQ